VPELVTVKVTEPGAAVAALNSIEYSLSVGVMAVVDGDGDAALLSVGVMAVVDGDGDAAPQAVARIINPTSPARAVCRLLMLPPRSLCATGGVPAD
jgi:hypothetical protein